ncbi:MAG: hypothetical protein HQL94_04675 [Magnetococcales bacterium]|nr:hypothetical protein [Magnetococcales bacterium]
MVKIDSQSAAWLVGLREEVAGFMAGLRYGDQPGRYLPCYSGATKVGRTAGLGFSCFANKIEYTIGLWDTRSHQEQQAWLDFIRSYQRISEAEAPFMDPFLLDGIPLPKERFLVQMRRWLSGLPAPSPKQDAILAETKQALATLAQHNETPWKPFSGFPLQEKQLNTRLRQLDWSQPWSAGAKTALLAVFIQTQGAERALAAVVSRYLDSLADPKTGGYFLSHKIPLRGQLINGAMKVLNALDWLEMPIHYPEALIDTCLLQGPPPAGCHVVDWVYVVHRCGLQTDHRLGEIQEKCKEIIALIRTHQNRDKGFSYAPGKAQEGYYGAKISLGHDEGDIHGTCLLTWALAMILEILEWPHLGWKVIRP